MHGEPLQYNASPFVRPALLATSYKNSFMVESCGFVLGPESEELGNQSYKRVTKRRAEAKALDAEHVILKLCRFEGRSE